MKSWAIWNERMRPKTIIFPLAGGAAEKTSKVSGWNRWMPAQVSQHTTQWRLLSCVLNFARQTHHLNLLPTNIRISRETTFSVCSHINTLQCQKRNIWEYHYLAWGGHWGDGVGLPSSNYSQPFSPGKVLNSDVSAFLRLQRHSPGSTSGLKRTSPTNKARILPKRVSVNNKNSQNTKNMNAYYKWPRPPTTLLAGWRRQESRGCRDIWLKLWNKRQIKFYCYFL